MFRAYIPLVMAACLLAVASPAAPAFAMKGEITVPDGTEAVPATTAANAATYNKCVSNAYSALRNRTATVNDTMGRYRENYGVANRAILANNVSYFNEYMRKALPDGQIVAPRCVYAG